MANQGALYRLLTWLSPSYPIGAYTYSHGIEQAVEAGQVADAGSATEWIGDVVQWGAGFSDTVFLLETMRGNQAAVAEFAAAFVASKELALESHAQGDAFMRISGDVWSTPALERLRAEWDGPIAYPVVVGCLAASHRIAEDAAALAYLHAFAANLVSAAVRLVPLGQTDGQRLMARLEPLIGETVERAMACPYPEATNAAFMTDICSMKHETQHTRLFRS